VDSCTTIHSSPVVVSDSISSSQSIITLQFDQTMHPAIVNSRDMSLSMSGLNSPYSVSWNALFSGSKLEVSYTVSPAIIGGLGESILLSLSDVKQFKSSHMIPISAPISFTFSFDKIDASQGAQSGGAGASYTFIFTILISLGISLFSGGSMELMWSLANTLQMIFFMALLDINYSPDLLAIFGFMRYSNFDNPMTEYVNDILSDTLNFIKKPLSEEFGNLGFGSTNIILNSFDKLLVVILMVLFALFVACLVY